jgi:hypothetical protein
MATLNLSMPKTMREWIDAQIKAGEYANASDYRLSRYLPLPGCVGSQDPGDTTALDFSISRSYGVRPCSAP